MNGMRISNNNNFNIQNSYDQRYNTFKNSNLMSYENSMNLINQSYNKDNDVFINNINNMNEKEKEQLPQVEEDEPIVLERSLCDYINNNFLSDAVLKLNDFEFYFHKIVLIACSDFLNNFFISIKDKTPEEKQPEEKKENEEENNEAKPQDDKYKNKIVVNFPEIISSSFGGGNKKNCLEKILKYCYSNQNFKSIESDINQYNIFSLLELAHSLGIKSLKLNLEKKIIKNHLGKDNATKLAIESKIFDLKKLNKECINYITQYFKDVKIFKNDIIDLDFDTFKNIMNSDSINIDTEKDVADFVLNYIKSRRDLPEEEKEEKPEIKEEQIKPKENENNEENKNIEENKKEEENNEEEKKEEEKKEEENKDEIKKDEDENEKWKKYLYELKDATKRKKLTKEQEKELIMCIRFSYLPHHELNKLINEPVMNDFKDILLQALSLKLNSYEETQNIDNNNSIFNSKPRLCFKKIANNDNNINNNNNVNNMNNNYQEYPNNYDIINNNNNQSMPNLQNAIYNQNKNNFNQNIPNNLMYKSMYNKQKNKNNYIPNIKEEYKNDNIDNYNEYDDEENNNNNSYSINQNQNEFDDNNENISEEDSSNNNINAQFFNINNPKEKEKRNRYQKMFKSEKTNKTTSQNKNKKINESISSEVENKSKNENISNITTNYNPKFKYKTDFDHNGALYYLGTRGLTKDYENPHKLKLIKAFGSSLLSGNFSDFVGRKYTNLSTENEENSFFGIDLGPNRNLIPTSYSLKNRDSDMNVLLCWNFQGSNDKINFVVLDKRTFMSETDEKLNDKTRKYRHLLKKPKTTSTWGVSKKIREKYPQGFRYFLLKQIGKNSSKNYHLALSGFEIYGESVGSGWIFN